MSIFLDFAKALSGAVTNSAEVGIAALGSMFAVATGKAALAVINRAFGALLAIVPSPVKTGVMLMVRIVGGELAAGGMIGLAAIIIVLGIATAVALARGFWLAVVGAAVAFVTVLVVFLAILWLWLFGRLFRWVGRKAPVILELLAEPYIGLVDDMAASWAEMRRRFEER